MEYSIDFAERLIDAADSFIGRSQPGEEASRAVLYLSLLSCEISLKAALEKAGFTPDHLRKRSHNLNDLLGDLCRCETWDEKTGGWVSAAHIKSISPVPGIKLATVGRLLDAESDGASKYPNSIRYGDLIKHYDSVHLLRCAKAVAEWSMENMAAIRQRP
jgi:hypothetical protein